MLYITVSRMVLNIKQTYIEGSLWFYGESTVVKKHTTFYCIVFGAARN